MADNRWEGRPFHAHWRSESRDCDGMYTRGGTYRQFFPDNEWYQYEWDDDLELLDQLVLWAYKLPEWDYSSLEIGRDSFGNYRIRSYRQTDEGYDWLEVWMCQDPDCDLGEKPTFRDHTAEAAGY